MRSAQLTVTMLALVTSVAPAMADRHQLPKPKLFASENGAYWARLIPDGWQSSVELFRYDPASGEDASLWKQDLGFVPAKLLVGDGWVVGVDDKAARIPEGQLVIWNKQGAQVAAHDLKDFLPATERTGLAARGWFKGACYRFEHDLLNGAYDRLHMTLSWGRSLVIDLRTGELITAAAAPSTPVSMMGFQDDAGFVLYQGDRQVGRVQGVWDGSGSFVATGHNFRFEVQSDTDGRWKDVAFVSDDGCDVRAVRAEDLMTGVEGAGALAWKRLGSNPMIGPPFPGRAPGSYSQAIRAFDWEAGVPVAVTRITPDLKSDTFILNRVGERRVAGLAPKFQVFRTTCGREIWADRDRRIYLVAHPAWDQWMVRIGYKTLLKHAGRSE